MNSAVLFVMGSLLMGCGVGVFIIGMMCVLKTFGFDTLS